MLSNWLPIYELLPDWHPSSKLCLIDPLDINWFLFDPLAMNFYLIDLQVISCILHWPTSSDLSTWLTLGSELLPLWPPNYKWLPVNLLAKNFRPDWPLKTMNYLIDPLAMNCLPDWPPCYQPSTWLTTKQWTTSCLTF